MQRLSRAGFSSAFVRAAVLPDWWGPECEDDPRLVGDLEFRVARFLGKSVEEIGRAGTLVAPAYPGARLKHVRSVDKDRLCPALHAGLVIAGAAVRSISRDLPVSPPPADPAEWRAEMITRDERIDLAIVVEALWRRGIPVLHVDVLPTPRFQGMACVIDGRPVILLGADRDEPAWLLFTLLHEAGHIANGDCDASSPLVDEDDDVPDDDSMEVRANRYAVAALGALERALPGEDVEWKQLAAAAHDLEQKQHTDAGNIILLWARRHRDYRKAQMALAALWKAHGAKLVLRELTDAHLDIEGASDTDRALLRCLFEDPGAGCGYSLTPTR